jgi:hypothetical protein
LRIPAQSTSPVITANSDAANAPAISQVAAIGPDWNPFRDATSNASAPM